MISKAEAAGATVGIWAWGLLGALVLWMLEINPWWSALVALGASGLYLFFWMLAGHLATISGAAELKSLEAEREDMDPKEAAALVAEIFAVAEKKRAEGALAQEGAP